MNSRKFYLILASILSAFLFLGGIASLVYLKTNNTQGANGIFSELLDPFRLSSEPVNILVLGGDRVAKNTDTMMLVNYNPATAKLNILSIPRDTKVKVKGSSLPKINSAFPIGGANLAVDTVSSFLNVKIKYYVFIDTGAFRKIIDILGGIDITVPVDMDYDDPVQSLHVHLKKGEQHMDGATAEEYVRFRHPNNYKNKEVMQYYDGSDLKRIDAQQNFIKELIKQKANVLYLTKLNSIVDEIFTNLETNLNLNDTLKLAQGLDKLSLSSVTMFKLPGNDDDEGSAGWYYACDKVKTAEIIKENFTAAGNFVNNTTPNKNTNINEKPAQSTVPKKAPAATKPKQEEKIDVTKDNPSNTESSINSPPPGAP